MPDTAKIVVFEVSVFDSEDCIYGPSVEIVCRKKAEFLDFRSGLDYLHAVDVVNQLDLSPGDRIRVSFRVLYRPPYKLVFFLESEYMGFYEVKSGIDSSVLTCESFNCLTEVD